MKILLVCFCILSPPMWATSINKPKFSEENILKSSFDVVIGEIVDAHSLEHKRKNCFTSVIKLKVRRSYGGVTEVDRVIEIGLTDKTAVLPRTGESYFMVYENKVDDFYSWCKKPNLKSIRNEYNIEKLNIVYLNSYARLFSEENRIVKFEFSACNKADDFLYQSKLKTAQISMWVNPEGVQCKNLIGNYSEFESLFTVDLNKKSRKRNKGDGG